MGSHSRVLNKRVGGNDQEESGWNSFDMKIIGGGEGWNNWKKLKK